MFLQIQEPAVRIFTIFAPVAISQTAMFLHAVAAYQPVVPKITGTRNKVAGFVGHLPSHFTAAYLAVNCFTLHHAGILPIITDFNVPKVAV